MDHQSSDHSQRNGLSKSAYETAFELAAVGMAMVSPQGHWIRVNRCLCEIVGYTESELLKLAFQDITHPEDLDTDMHLVNQMLSGKIETYSLEKRYIHKNGSLIWILLTVALVWNQDGTPRHFISCVQNIMARKKAQDDLRTHRWQLKLLLDHAPAATALFDRNMRYIECSERWLTDYGLTGQTLRVSATMIFSLNCLNTGSEFTSVRFTANRFAKKKMFSCVRMAASTTCAGK